MSGEIAPRSKFDRHRKTARARRTNVALAEGGSQGETAELRRPEFDFSARSTAGRAPRHTNLCRGDGGMAGAMTEHMIERQCERCGATFLVVPSRVRNGRGKHCSPACQYAARRAQPRNAIQCKCLACGKEFGISPSRLRHKGAGKYCSRSCRDSHWIGSATPNWQGAREPHRHGPNWYSARRRALERDEHTCQHCGATERLHVHHELPGRLFASTRDANELDNLITLCDRCHRREESRAWWTKIGHGIGSDGGALQFTPNGPAWQLAKQAGLL